MDKKLLLIWTFLLCFVMGISADKVITFNENTGSSDSSAKLTTMAEIVKTGSEYLSDVSDINNVYLARAGRGLKQGTSSKQGKFTLDFASEIRPTAIKFTALKYKDSEATINVAGTDFTLEGDEVAEYSLVCNGSAITSVAISTPKRAYITSVTIVEGEAPKVLAPTISGTTPFLGTTTVTLACETQDAKIYYTLDGNDPTASSTAYAEPFTLDATTKVKAIAIKGADKSSVVTKTFEAIPVVADIATLNALPDKALFALGGETTVVAIPDSRYLYIKDATGSSLIYGASDAATLEPGQHIAANWTGSVSYFNKLFEAVPSSALTAVEGVKDEVTFDEFAPADIVAAKMNKVGVLKNVHYYITAEASGKAKANYEFETEDGTIIKGYDQFSKNLEQAAPYDYFDVVGAIGVYNDNVQFWPISVTRIPQTQDISIDNVETGANLSDIIKAERADVEASGDKVGGVYINLAAGGEYTVTEPIVSGGDFVLTGDATAPATIDASALAEPFVKLDGCEILALNADGTENANYKSVATVMMQNLKIKGLAKSLVNDAQKSLVDNVNIDNVDVELVGSSAVFDFKGYPASLSIANSTLWSKDGHKGYLLQTKGRVKDLDGNQATYQEVTSITNSTLYKVAVDKQFNNLQGKGQKSLQFILKNSIIAESTQTGNEVRGWLGGQNSNNPTVEYANNTYFAGGAEQAGWTDASKQGSDQTATSRNTDPEFSDAANGNFTVFAGSQQAKYKIGDPCWLVEYDKSQARPMELNLSLNGGGNINEALANGLADIDNLKSVSITLEDNATYTVTAPIEVAAPLNIAGVKETPATIDASANAGAFIQLSATPSENLKEEGNDYYHIKGYVSLSNLNINGVKAQLVYDSNVKYCVENLTIDNCKVNLASDEATGVNGNAVVYFKGGFANTLSVSNSTFWNTGASDAKYFVQYNNSGRAPRAGYLNNYVIFQNNTFHNVAVKGQWANYGGFAGQKTSSFIVTDNIFSNCGSGQIARRILGGRQASTYADGMVTFNNNTYMTKTLAEDNTETVAFENAEGYDVSGTIIEMDPMFANAANADFTLGASTKQAKMKTGDPRWLVEFVAEDVTDAKALLLAEIEKATKLLGNADVETDEAAKALKEAIDKAQGVYDTSEFNAELNKATEELKAAEEAYIATGISSVNAETTADGAWYTLQGVKVVAPVKGNIYLHNGKKVILK